MSIAATILVVDDEPAIQRLLRSSLEAAGYQVTVSGTAADAVTQLARSPDLVLLDLGLPDRNGLEILPIIARRSRAAVLVVSARDATEEKVAALDLGAVDYVTKPFDTDELLARVRAALRSRAIGDGGQSVVTAGEVAIDLVDRRITRSGEEVHLTPKEFGVLAELARFPGRAITHHHLLRTVWPNDRDGHVEYLRVVVRNMRQKLEVDPAMPTLIVNDMGVGYRLIAG
ncbi:MAG: response regulator [Janthinobacterium lividum]